MLLMTHFSALYHFPRTLNNLSSSLILPDGFLNPGVQLPEVFVDLFHPIHRLPPATLLFHFLSFGRETLHVIRLEYVYRAS